MGLMHIPIPKKGEKQATYLVVANYLSPSEIKDVQYEDGHIEKKNVREGKTKEIDRFVFFFFYYIPQ